MSMHAAPNARNGVQASSLVCTKVHIEKRAELDRGNKLSRDEPRLERGCT